MCYDKFHYIIHKITLHMINDSRGLALTEAWKLFDDFLLKVIRKGKWTPLVTIFDKANGKKSTRKLTISSFLEHLTIPSSWYVTSPPPFPTISPHLATSSFTENSIISSWRLLQIVFLRLHAPLLEHSFPKISSTLCLWTYFRLWKVIAVKRIKLMLYKTGKRDFAHSSVLDRS